MKRKTRIITTSIAAAAIVVGAGAAYAVAAGDGEGLDNENMQRARDAALAEAGGGTVTEIESDDGGYDVEVRLDDGTEIEIELGNDFTVRATESGQVDDGDDDGRDDDDLPVDEATRQRATDAALASAGGGTVTEVEHDGNGFDVEVRLDDGTELDIDLAPDFSVLHKDTDD